MLKDMGEAGIELLYNSPSPKNGQYGKHAFVPCTRTHVLTPPPEFRKVWAGLQQW